MRPPRAAEGVHQRICISDAPPSCSQTTSLVSPVGDMSLWLQEPKLGKSHPPTDITKQIDLKGTDVSVV
ncbi:MAG: hypothetical protein ACR5K7_05720 [Symbiopectobacterium sp.]